MRIGVLVGALIIFSLFAGNASASFLDDEAGISAYTKANTNIDLNKAKNAFRTIERQTSNYIIGSVAILNLPITEDVHVYVNSSGWILAYYLRDEPASKIIQWQNYNGGAITTTKLADVISNVAGQAGGVGYSPIKYYDFKYTSSNRLMIIVKWLGDGTATGSFDFKVPGSYVLNEASYSHDDTGGHSGSRHSLDNTIVSPTINWLDNGIIQGYYSSISPDVFHTIKIEKGYGASGNAGVATTLVYQEQ